MDNSVFIATGGNPNDPLITLSCVFRRPSVTRQPMNGTVTITVYPNRVMVYIVYDTVSPTVETVLRSLILTLFTPGPPTVPRTREDVRRDGIRILLSPTARPHLGRDSSHFGRTTSLVGPSSSVGPQGAEGGNKKVSKGTESLWLSDDEWPDTARPTTRGHPRFRVVPTRPIKTGVVLLVVYATFLLTPLSLFRGPS